MVHLPQTRLDWHCLWERTGDAHATQVGTIAARCIVRDVMWEGEWKMQKCLSCGGTIRNVETSCFLCGTAVPPTKHKVSFHDRFRTIVKFAFVASSVMTVASLFFSIGPGFTKCFVATLVLTLVKSSAEQMSASQ